MPMLHFPTPFRHILTTVDGELVHDLDPTVVSGAQGRVYLEDGITTDDAALLARAATYRAALFEERIAGAAVTIRPRLVDTDDETLSRVQGELGAFDDRWFTIVDEPASPALGAAAGTAAWFGGLEGRRVAIHGFNDLGVEVALAVAGLGGRVVGISTDYGAVASNEGLDPATLEGARAANGDAFVTRIGLEVHLPFELVALGVDALVLTGGVGSIDTELATQVGADVVVPVSDAPYTAGGLETLRRRRIVALPDIATTAGPMLESLSPRGLSAPERSARAQRLISERIAGARQSKIEPFLYASALAETFLATWIPAPVRPDGPAVRTEPSIP